MSRARTHCSHSRHLEFVQWLWSWSALIIMALTRMMIMMMANDREQIWYSISCRWLALVSIGWNSSGRPHWLAKRACSNLNHSDLGRLVQSETFCRLQLAWWQMHKGAHSNKQFVRPDWRAWKVYAPWSFRRATGAPILLPFIGRFWTNFTD